jgi:hypothetical protein
MTIPDASLPAADDSRFAFHRRGYRLKLVYGQLPPAGAEAIVAMWLAAGVLPEAEARRRVAEVACVVYDPGGRVVGVNTVYPARLQVDGPAYYFYRTFLLPEARALMGLPRAMLRLAMEHLRARRDGLAGLVVVTENPKLMRRAVIARLAALGFRRLGKDPRGYDVWCFRFDAESPTQPSDFSTH